MKPVIVWFRQDLRLSDNPALLAAAACGRPVLCLYILDDETPGSWRPGGASRWWLHGSLERLRADLEAIGGALTLRSGKAESVLPAVAAEIAATGVYWNRRYEPYAVACETALRARLNGLGIEVHSFNGSLLVEPWDLRTASGQPYRVFNPFWRNLRQAAIPDPVAPPSRLSRCLANTETLSTWRLRPVRPDWAAGLHAAWEPGEAASQSRLAAFVDRAAGYASARDRPDVGATSRLSPHLHFGEVSPRQVWHAVRHRADTLADGGEKFLSELGWREFAHHLLFNNPSLPERPLDAKFAELQWADAPASLHAWQRGATGIPIVDAGMRQLWQAGWMHNRVRMIAASFLVKHLLIDWRQGEAWFWDTLVDADLANNAAGWQWIAGCGADAAPYFRIFNPVLQGEKFDPAGVYVREFVPELSNLSSKFIHRPWTASDADLRAAGLRLGENYPLPIVNLPAGRERALAAFRAIKPGNRAPRVS